MGISVNLQSGKFSYLLLVGFAVTKYLKKLVVVD